MANALPVLSKISWHISYLYMRDPKANSYKSKMIYVPKALEEEISAKAKTYHKIKELVDKISELNYSNLEVNKKGDVKKDNKLLEINILICLI